jgi:hypothetical protein
MVQNLEPIVQLVVSWGSYFFEMHPATPSLTIFRRRFASNSILFAMNFLLDGVWGSIIGLKLKIFSVANR